MLSHNSLKCRFVVKQLKKENNFMFRKILVLVMIVSSFVLANTFKENQSACESSDAKACYEAALTYSAEAYKEEGYSQAKAAAKVATLYKKSCSLNYAPGCTAYGMSYAADTNKDPQKNAQYYFQKGCDGGDEAGCNLLKLAKPNN
jgi:hypothetical protein